MKKIAIFGSIITLGILLLFSIVNAALVDNSIPYYKLDESAGVVIDSTGNSDGTASQVVRPVTGKINTAYRFGENTTSYVDTNYQVTYTDYAINFWINLTVQTENRFLGAGTDGQDIILLMKTDTGVFSVFTRDANGNGETLTGSTEIDDGSYYMGILRRIGTNTSLWVNDVCEDSGTTVTANIVLDRSFRIGCYKHNGDVCDTPKRAVELDEVGFWTRGISDAEIAELWNSGAGNSYPFVVDTCTCPGAGNNWEIDMSDNCQIDDACDLTTGTLSFIGAGYCNCNASIDTTNLGDPGASGTLYIQDSCLITVD